MVQIIRDQMRNYTPDMSTANHLAEGARVMGDWADTFKKMGSIAGQIGQEQAKSEALAVKQQKEAEQAQKLAQTEMENADRTMIDTQIGNRAQTDLMQWNAEQIMAGVDPNTDAYTQALYAKRDEIYQPYIERMTTEKGRNMLQKQALDTGERLRQSNIGKIAQNRQKAIAAQAFNNSARDQAQEARDFGKNGDWKGYQDASKDTRKAMVDYIAAQAAAEAAKMQAAGIDPQAVIENQQLQAAQAKLDSTKADAKKMQAEIDSLRNKVYQDVEKANPKATEKQKEKVFKDLYPEEVAKEKAIKKGKPIAQEQKTESKTEPKQKKKAEPKKIKTRQQVATDVTVQKKLMKGGDASKQAAEYIVDTQSMQSYMSGVAEEDPQKAIMMLGDKETIMKNQQEELAKDNVSWGNKLWGLAMNAAKFMPGGQAVEAVIKEQGANPEAWYEASGLEKQGREELDSVIPDSVRQVKTEVVTTQAKQEQQALKDRLKNLEKGSDAYALVEKQIKDLQAVIDDPTDKVLDSVREDLETSVLPEARKNFDLQKLAAQEREARQTVETYTMSLSPDKETSNAANFALLFGQPAAESMFNMSISPDEMYKSWERFYENGNKVEFNKEVTFEGTKSVADALADLTSYQGNNPLEIIKYAMDAQSALAESGQMTQGQKDEVRQILNTAVQDKAFADMTSDIFNNKDRYYPDISWFAKTFVEPAPGVDLVGLPNNMRNVDVDELEKYVKVETSRATQDTIGRLAVAAQMQDPEMRKQAVIDAGEFLVGEKRRIFDHAMDNYGIDMQALREAKRTRGQAFTQVGTSVKEYMGDDPSTGEPIWRDMRENKEAYKAATIRALLGTRPGTKSAQGE